MPVAPVTAGAMVESKAVRGFLGLAEDDSSDSADVVILQVPYELTTSYGQGTAAGPAACVAASAQVELHDPLLPADLPCGYRIRTHAAWDGTGDSLVAQQDGIVAYLADNLGPSAGAYGSAFPIVLGGEHGMLPAVMRALARHPALADGAAEGHGDGDDEVDPGDVGGRDDIGASTSLARLTLVQVDAHADLRDELDGDPMSHACAARRALDAGVGRLLQAGVRAYSREEAAFSDSEPRVETHFARDLLSPGSGEGAWTSLLSTIRGIEGPVWLTFDVDGLDGSLVPTTGTPVPGGLSWWHAVELIEALFSAPAATVLGADVVEIVPSAEGDLTEFTAAMLATKIIAAHLARRIREEGA